VLPWQLPGAGEALDPVVGLRDRMLWEGVLLIRVTRLKIKRRKRRSFAREGKAKDGLEKSRACARTRALRAAWAGSDGGEKEALWLLRERLRSKRRWGNECV
jgi:hypothetical protein